jgi:hypothetical protein
MEAGFFDFGRTSDGAERRMPPSSGDDMVNSRLSIDAAFHYSAA